MKGDRDVPDAEDWSFIIGSSCSGTTVLVKILNAHSDVCFLNEAWLFGYIQILSLERMYLKDEKGITYNNEYLPYSLLKNKRLYEAISENLNVNYKEVPFMSIRHLMEGLRKGIAPEAVILGDKKGGYRRSVEDVNEIFPQCKMFLTTRNKWDVTASFFYSKNHNYQPH